MTVAFSAVAYSADETTELALSELTAYLHRMGNRLTSDATPRMEFRVGVFADTGIDPGKYGTRVDLGRAAADDRIVIDVGPDGGVLSGSNPRSVLFAVYRYLKACGCRFLGPMPWMEHVPSGTAPRSITQGERPSFRYRALTIEGGIGAEDLNRLIDWLPKAGFNAYHLQLDSNYAFFNRWYRTAEGGQQPRTIQECRAITANATRETKRRGLDVWSMGHGWVCGAMGVPALAWEPSGMESRTDTPVRLAQVDGVRHWWRNIPIDTNACYSDPDTRRAIVEFAADYAADHASVDVLFFWMADDVNNHCECADCREKLPSDWYVDMLNELDRELDRRSVTTRIGFLIFCETLWPPRRETLANPDRFLLIFAPMGVSSLDGLIGVSGDAMLPEFALNNIAGEDSPDISFGFLEKWQQQQFGGEAVVLIYDLLATGLDKDLTGMRVARAINTTLRTYHGLGVAGVSSCQAQRAFFPTGWQMNVLAETLWNVDVDLDTLRDDVFQASFGENGTEVADVLDEVTELIDPAFVQQRVGRDADTCRDVARRCRGLADRLIAAADDLERSDVDGAVGSAQVLRAYATFLPMVCDIYLARGEGADTGSLLQQWQTALDGLRSSHEVLKAFDVEWFERTFRLLNIEDRGGVTNYDP